MVSGDVDDEPRRSKRARKRPESLYDVARAEQEERRQEALREEEEEEEEEEQGEDEEFEKAMRQSRRRPAAAKKRSRKKASSVSSSLFDAMKGFHKRKKKSGEAAAEALVEEFGSSPRTATGRFLQFVFECCGATDTTFVGDSVDVSELGKEEWNDYVEELCQQLQISPAAKKFSHADSFAAFLQAIAFSCGGKTEALETIADVTATLSGSSPASARYVGTVGAMAIGAAAAKVAETTSQHLATAARQLKADVGTSSSRSRAIEDRATEWRRDLENLENVCSRLLQAVVAQRYRDARSNVRVACAQGIAEWISASAACPSPLFKYFGYMLHFREASDRIAACAGLDAAFQVQKSEEEEEDEDVSRQIATRLAEMGRADVEFEARTHALKTLRQCVSSTTLDEDTSDDVMNDLVATILDESAKGEARTEALSVALILSSPLSQGKTRAEQLYELASFVDAALLVEEDEIDQGKVELVAKAFLGQREEHFGVLLRDWSAYLEVLLREDVDLGSKCRRPVAVLVGLLASAAASSSEEDSPTALAPSVARLLNKFALGESAEIAVPLLNVAKHVLPPKEDTVKFVFRCLRESVDQIVVRTAANAISFFFDKLTDASQEKRILEEQMTNTLDALSKDLISALAEDDDDVAARSALSRLARATEGGIDLAASFRPQRLLETTQILADKTTAESPYAVDALGLLSSLAETRTRKALAGDREDIDTALTRCLPRLLISILSADDDLSVERMKTVHAAQLEAAKVAGLSFEVCDPRFSFYDGLEHLALTTEEQSRLTELVVDLCQRHALPDVFESSLSFRRAAEELWEEKHTPDFFQGLVRVAVADCRRSRQFVEDEEEDDESGARPASSLLAAATMADQTVVLREACLRINAIYDFEEVGRDRLAIADIHVDALREFVARAGNFSDDDGDEVASDFARALVAASDLDRHPEALCRCVEVGVRLGVEEMPDSAKLLPLVQQYLDALLFKGKKTHSFPLDVENLVAAIRKAHGYSSETDEVLETLEGKLEQLDERRDKGRRGKRVKKRRAPPERDEPNASPVLSVDEPPPSPSPIRDVSNRPNSRLASSSKTNSKRARRDSSMSKKSYVSSTGPLDKIQEEEDDEEAPRTIEKPSVVLSPHRRVFASPSSRQILSEEEDEEDSPLPASRRSVRLSSEHSQNIFSEDEDDEEPFPEPRSTVRLSDISN